MYSVNCNYCNKTITTAANFKRHCETTLHKSNYINSLKQPSNNTPAPKTIQVQVSNINKSDDYTCINCNKKYSNKSNFTRHSKTCKATQAKITQFGKEYLEVVSGNKSLMDVLEQLKDASESTTTNNITINIHGDTTNIHGDNTTITNTTNTTNTINNTMIDYRNINNILLTSDQKEEIFNKYWKDNKVNPVGYEDLSMFEDINVIKDLFSRGMNFYGSYLGHVYSIPANLNIQTYDKKNGLISVIYKTGEIIIMTNEDVEHNILMNCLDKADALMDKYIKDTAIPDHHRRIVQKLAEQHEPENNKNMPRYIKLVKLAVANISESPLNCVKRYKEKYKKDVLENGIFKLPYPGTNMRTEPTNK